MDATTTPILSDADVATLNAARTILVNATRAYISAGMDEGECHSLGFFTAYADAAAHTIFMALNVYKNHGVGPLTDDQLHNREPEPEPEPRYIVRREHVTGFRPSYAVLHDGKTVSRHESESSAQRWINMVTSAPVS